MKTHTSTNSEGESPQNLREQIQQIRNEPGMKDSILANQIGVGKTVFSLWLNDNYTGNNDAINAKVADYLAKREEAKSMEKQISVPEDPPFYETPTAMRVIWPMLQYAQLRGSMALLYGGAGVCKSSTFREYQRRMPNVWIIGVTPATSRLTSFLSLTASTMGITTISNKPAIVEQSIVDKMVGCKGLLIVDDAQYLPVETLYEIAWMRERAGVGIVMAGNESIHGRMQAGFAQLYSRVGKRKKLNRPQLGDLEACLTAWERQLELDSGALNGPIKDFFWGKGDGRLGPARQDGGLRNVTECLALSSFFASGSGDAIALKHVRAAWNDISGIDNNEKGGR